MLNAQEFSEILHVDEKTFKTKETMEIGYHINYGKEILRNVQLFVLLSKLKIFTIRNKNDFYFAVVLHKQIHLS